MNNEMDENFKTIIQNYNLSFGEFCEELQDECLHWQNENETGTRG
jgi:hypothetical protein